MGKEKAKSIRNIIFNLIITTLALMVVIYTYKTPITTTIILAILTVIGLIKWKSKLTLIIFILGGIFFPIAEMIASGFDVWQYSLPNVFGVPIWLFLLWGIASAFIYQTAIEIKRLGVKN